MDKTPRKVGSNRSWVSNELADHSTPEITAFANAPDQGRGLARDMAVRWAMEEVGHPYRVRRLSFQEMKEADHLTLSPFGQIPTYRHGDLVLFESGAIVLHIAETYDGLLPQEAVSRRRAIMWIFAALSTIEPPILDLQSSMILERRHPWHEVRLPIVRERISARLIQLSNDLGKSEWLENTFSAGDLMMVAVLRRLSSTGLLETWPNLAAYVARAEARPAFKRAFAEQRAAFSAYGEGN